tara:strand:- start:1602 stop:2585 length:984 start_codon:yes stop_codon:yes gene_type:complete
MVLFTLSFAGHAEPIYRISMDGNFDDWAEVPSYTDPVDDQHDTDQTMATDVPAYVDHEDVDLVEFKFTHDEDNFYGYFKSRGVIGRTLNSGAGTGGRYYVIITIDMDNDDSTGYPLHEGGYFPTTTGYDLNMEVEYFDGTFNTGHYLLHGCLDATTFMASEAEQSQGYVTLVPGNYDCYTQWVWYDTPPGYANEIIIPTGEAIYWVVDKGPVYPDSIVEIFLSADGHEAEMKAPFRGFMKDGPGGRPIIELGDTIDVSFSLEASGELAVGAQWASDTADPINGYVLGNKDATTPLPLGPYAIGFAGVFLIIGGILSSLAFARRQSIK